MGKIEVFEDQRAFGYDQFVMDWIPGYRYFLECLPRVLREASPRELLVVGCGTGNEIERFVLHDGAWKITGIDPSPDMISQARERFQNFQQVRLVGGVASDLPADEKYHAATLSLVLHFMPDSGDKLHLLKSIADRLVSDAPFVMLDITGSKKRISENLKILKNLLPDGLEEGQVSERLERIRTELFPVSEKRIAELCTEAGFKKPLRFFQSSIYMGWMARKI